MPPVQVSVNSTLPSGSESFIRFSIPSPVSGVTASGPELIFAPGFYEVTIHLPPGLSGAGIHWTDGVSPPSGGIIQTADETSVTFGVNNSEMNASFQFNLTYQTISSSIKGATDGPTIVSDPPPSVELRSS